MSNDYASQFQYTQENDYRNLFPYLLFDDTPIISSYDVDNRFISPPQSVLQSPEFSSYVDAAKSDDRAKIETLAVTYIKSSDFISSPNLFDDKLQGLLAKLQNQDPRGDQWQNLLVDQFGSVEAFKNYVTTSGAAFIKRLWLSTIALIIELDYDTYWLNKLIQILKAIFVLAKIADTMPMTNTNTGSLNSPQIYASNGSLEILDKTKVWQAASLALPEALFPLPSNVVKPALLPAVPYAVGTLKRMNYKLTGYKIGEIQKIETILSGETRKSQSRTRRLDTTMEVTESKDHTEQTNTHNLTTDDLSSWVEKARQGRLIENTVDQYQTDYAPTSPMAVTNGSWSIVESPQGDEETTKQSFAKSLIDNAVNRAFDEVSKARQVIGTIEHENTQSHIFSNRETNNINGVYFWLNKVFSVQEHHSAKRIMVSIDVDLPDLSVRQLLSQMPELDVQKPISLTELGITHFSQIELEKKTAPATSPSTSPATPSSNHQPADTQPSHYYLDLCEQFAVEAPESPPIDKKVITGGLKLESTQGQTQISIPVGYRVDSAVVTVQTEPMTPVESVMIAGQVIKTPNDGGQYQYANKTPQSGSSDESISQLFTLPISLALQEPKGIEPTEPSKDSGPASLELNTFGAQKQVRQDHAKGALADIIVVTSLSPEAKLAWQYKLYTQLKHAYIKQEQAYEQQVATRKQILAQESNPVIQALIHQNLLKASKAVLFAQAKALVGSDTNSPQDPLPFDGYADSSLDWAHLYCKLEQHIVPDQNNAAQQMGRSQSIATTSILEQLDPTLFLSRYLRATKAKLLVPITRGCEIAFLYYLETGRIWHGEESLAPVNFRSLAIVNDFKQLPPPSSDDDEQQNSWSVVMPTTMSILSSNRDISDLEDYLNER
ncbi:hypothetical protein [Vibrio cionasavignyae]|uniref:hypothetical protein n=1 Tax=Vibrio cionasavignyae TaxID=2910252 RepID=UPI003D107B4A